LKPVHLLCRSNVLAGELLQSPEIRQLLVVFVRPKQTCVESQTGVLHMDLEFFASI
jgi:hypothetical protein